MRHGRRRMQQLDRWVDEKTGTHRKMFSDDAAKKGERLWYVPITTNNQRNNNCENKPQKERLKTHRDLSGILFTVILKLSHPTIIIPIDLTILHLCSCISIQIIYINIIFVLFHWIKFYKGLKLYILLQDFFALTWILKCWYLSLSQ